MIPLSFVRRCSAKVELVSSNYLRCQRSLCLRTNTGLTEFDYVDDENPNKYTPTPSRVMVPRTLSIVDDRAARDFAEIVRSEFKDDMPVMELHPGPGFLTEELLKGKIQNIFVYEPRSSYHAGLKLLFQRYDLIQNFFPKNLYSLFYENGKILAPETVHAKQIFPFQQFKNWDDSPSFTIIGAHTDFKFWLWMLLNVSRISKYHGMGRPQIIMAFPTKEWDNVLKHPFARRRGRHPPGFLFPDYFEWKVCGNIPRSAFLPLKRKLKFQVENLSDSDNKEIMVVSCISPSRNLFNAIDCTDLTELQYFVDQHFNAVGKKQYVIPTLEKWIPGCGRNLVLSGFTVTQKFEDLSCKDIMNLFLCFKSQPEYKSSAFLFGMKDPEVQYLPKKKRKSVDLE